MTTASQPRIYGLRDIIAKWDSLPIEMQLQAARLWPDRIKIQSKPETGRLHFQIEDYNSDFFDQHPAWRN